MSKNFASISATVVEVLQQFTQCSNEGDWVIEQTDSGGQASIFAVRREDGQPIQQNHLDLIVKLYKSTGQQAAELAGREFESLARLHARLHGIAVNGWNIASPIPLFRCQYPLALVMTSVPGQPLKNCLRTGDELNGEVLDSIADSVVAAMDRSWRNDGLYYGELNFDNILCDVLGRSISFVDPGGLDERFRCDAVSKNWYPASRDLGYLLYDIETSLRTTIANPSARHRARYLMEKIVRAYVVKAEPGYPAQDLLNEIESCARRHLLGIKTSWSPRGVWRSFVRAKASRGINQALGRVKFEAVVPRTDLRAECAVGGLR